MNKPVYEQLGYKDQTNYALINAPDDYAAMIGLPGEVTLVYCEEGCDIIHIFATTREKLEKDLKEAGKSLAKDGIIWVSLYNNEPDELDEDTIKDIADGHGLKMAGDCSIGQDWPCLKLVLKQKNPGKE